MHVWIEEEIGFIYDHFWLFFYLVCRFCILNFITDVHTFETRFDDLLTN
jgi:hypothetical protein